MTAGNLIFYPGDYDYYLEKSRAASAKSALTRGSNGHDGKDKKTASVRNSPGLREQKAQKRLEAETRNAADKAKRDKEKHLHDLETKIAALESKQKELAAVLEDPSVYESGGRATAINRELADVADDLARLTGEWETATSGISAPPALDAGNRQ